MSVKLPVFAAVLLSNQTGRTASNQAIGFSGYDSNGLKLH